MKARMLSGTVVYKGAEAMDAFVHSNINAILLKKQLKCLDRLCTKKETSACFTT